MEGWPSLQQEDNEEEEEVQNCETNSNYSVCVTGSEHITVGPVIHNPIIHLNICGQEAAEFLRSISEGSKPSICDTNFQFPGIKSNIKISEDAITCGENNLSLPSSTNAQEETSNEIIAESSGVQNTEAGLQGGPVVLRPDPEFNLLDEASKIEECFPGEPDEVTRSGEIEAAREMEVATVDTYGSKRHFEEEEVPKIPKVVSLSDLMDIILTETVKNADSHLRVDDIKEKIDWKIFGKVKLRGHLRATGGLLKDLKTISRIGECNCLLKEDSLTVSGSLSLGKLEVSYSTFEFVLQDKVVSKGEIKLSCKHNAVSIRLQLKHLNEDRYHIKLEELKIDNLSGLEVKMYPPEENPLMDLANWILEHFNSTLVQILSINLRRSMRKALSKTDVSNQLFYLLPKK